MNVRELVTRIDFDVNTKGLKSADRSVDSLKTNIGSLSKSLEGLKTVYTKIGTLASIVGGALVAFTSVAASNLKANDEMAEKIGITGQNLQELEALAQTSGAKVGELSASMLNLAKRARDAGEGVLISSREFNKLGVSVKNTNGTLKDTERLYTEVIKKLNNIKSPTERMVVAQKLLGTSSSVLIKTFSQSNEELAKQREEISKLTYTVDAKGTTAINKFIESWAKLRLMLKSIATSLSIQLMPAITETIENLKNWYIENKVLIQQNLKGLVDGITSAFKLFADITAAILKPITSLIELCGGLGNAVSVVATAMTVLLLPAIIKSTIEFAKLAVAIAANPFTWLAVAIGLLVNDMYHWINDNDSVLGSILGSWTDFKKDMTAIIDSIVDHTKMLFENLGYLFTSPLSGFKSNFDSLVDSFKNKSISVDVDAKNKGDWFEKSRDRSNVKHYKLNQGRLIDVTPSGSPISTTNNSNSTSNKVTQNITENITVNVPVGTTQEQAVSIKEQVTEAVTEQLRANLIRANDALAYR